MFLLALPFLLKIVPAIPHIVIGIETLFGKGNGPAKKQAAVDAVSDMVNLLSGLGNQSGTTANSHTMAFIDKIIEAVVAFMNASGQFDHSTPALPTPPAAGGHS